MRDGRRRVMRARLPLPGPIPALLLAGALLAASVLVGTERTSGGNPDGAAAAAWLGREHGKAASAFELVYERQATLARSGETMWVGKLVDLQTGAAELVYRDPSGTLGGSELPAGREEAAEARMSPMERKASPALQAATRATTMQTTTEDTLPVAVWISADVSGAEQSVIDRHPEVAWLAGRPMTDDLTLLRRIRGELWTARRDAYATAEAAVADAVASLGGSVAYSSTSAPLVFADLPPEAVAPLAVRDDVVSMGLEGAWAPSMSSAGPTVEADWSPGTEDAGAGIRVGIIEYHNVRGTGDLAGKVVGTWSASGTPAYTPSGSFDHPTWVAGAIAGQSSAYRGVAPGALIVSAGTGGYTPSLAYDRAIIAAADWAVSPGGGDVDIVNTSLVQDTVTGAEEARRFFDSIGYQDGRLPVSAAGNYVNFNDWRIGSPGTGYNVLTVGGIDDRNSVARPDDRIWYVPGSNGSNWLDRPSDLWNSHGDFNKPNLVAPAVSVRTANGLAASGTSVATPIVAGIAAQLLANRPGLAIWPEGVRALLTAGAVHHVPMPDGSRNADHEGVGMASALWTNRIAVAGDGPWGGYRIGALEVGQTLAQTVTVNAGDRLRVALAWSSRTSGSPQTGVADTLASDLDLRVRAPDGTLLGSYTLDNSYEFVEIAINTPGSATIEILPTRMDAGSERFGLAWAKVGMLSVTRLAGADRYATAAAISAAGWGPGVPVAYLATGANFPDALSAGPLAARSGGPILLVSRDSLPGATAAELARLRPGRIVLLGGAGVVGDAVAAAVAAYASSGSVTRLAGADRYATAAAISAAGWGENGAQRVFTATGLNFPDALAAAPLAALSGSPLLLTDPYRLSPPTAGEVVRLDPASVTLLGGPGALPDGLAAQIVALGG
ncbi:MAG TPA: cell wall-binding repeat-containing protein [Candidatus Limnocylindria bacterium]